MRIKIWGCRGSLPAPGFDTNYYGGNTTCIEVRSKNGDVVIVDAGSGIRNLGKALYEDASIRNLRFLLTHSHWDHLMGFPFFKPAYFSDFTLTFCNGPHAQNSIRNFLAHQMEAPYFPVDFSRLKAKFDFHCDNINQECRCCRYSSMEFLAIKLNHPNGGYGYKFIEDGRTFIFVPDNELGFAHENGTDIKEFPDLFRDADLLIHDAQYTEDEYLHTKGWGHSTYGQATDLAIAANVKRFGIFHHDPDRSDSVLDQNVEFCRKRIACSNNEIDCFAVAEGMVIDL